MASWKSKLSDLYHRGKEAASKLGKNQNGHHNKASSDSHDTPDVKPSKRNGAVALKPPRDESDQLSDTVPEEEEASVNKDLGEKIDLEAPPGILDFGPYAMRHFSPQSSGSPIAYIVVVGFHHRQGPVVEFTYPSPPAANTEQGKREQEEIFNPIPFLALPDAAHCSDDSFIYFVLPTSAGVLFCVGCYRQIDVSSLANAGDYVRNKVQKAVVVVSRVPFFGSILTRLEIVTHAYFEQKNFESHELLSSFYDNLNSLHFETMDYAQIYVGLSPRRLFKVLREKAFLLLKLLMLEGRILVFSSTPNRVCTSVLGLVSLIPGLITCGFRSDGIANSQQQFDRYGLPFAAFHQDCVMHPYISLEQMYCFTKKGYLLGTTNGMIFEHGAAKPDAAVNIDTGKIELLNKHISSCLSLTSKEKKIASQICRAVDSTWSDAVDTVSNTGQEGQSQWEGSDDWIRSEVSTYLKGLLGKVAAVMKRATRTSAAVVECADRLSDYNVRWVQQWLQTVNFQQWMVLHDESIYDQEFYDDPRNLPRNGLVTINFPNGDEFRGELKKGKRNGHGVYMDKNNGGRYEGGWTEDKRDGHGRLVIDSEQFLYEGEWKGDMRQGPGKLLHKGSQYNGYFIKNQFHGQGTMIDADGNIYEGEWQNGQMHGIGKYIAKNGEVYTGEFRCNKRHGMGQCVYPDGSMYSGSWQDDKRNGEGNLVEPSGDRFEGLFRDDMKNGNGSLTTVSADRLEGVWKDNNPMNGVWSIFYHNGDKFTGECQYFVPQGKGTCKYENGDAYDGSWVNGVREGAGVCFYANGDCFEGSFHDNSREGRGKLTKVSGDIVEAIWEHDEMLTETSVTWKKGDYIPPEERNKVLQMAESNQHNHTNSDGEITSPFALGDEEDLQLADEETAREEELTAQILNSKSGTASGTVHSHSSGYQNNNNNQSHEPLNLKSTEDLDKWWEGFVEGKDDAAMPTDTDTSGLRVSESDFDI